MPAKIARDPNLLLVDDERTVSAAGLPAPMEKRGFRAPKPLAAWQLVRRCPRPPTRLRRS